MNRTLKFSDIVKSNDYNEIIYLWDKYYEYIEKTIANKSAIPTLKYEIKNQLENTIFLALCFSRESDALHMWNCYADGGVAIGFDFDKLQEWKKHICYYVNSPYPNEATCAEMQEIKYYDKNKIEEYIAKKCSEIEFVTDKFGEVFLEAPFCKSNFFELEHELRIVINIFTSNDDSNKLQYIDKNGKTTDIKLKSFSNRNFDNVIYAAIPFPSDMITSITIGPNCKLNESNINGVFRRDLIFSRESGILYLFQRKL